MKYNFSVTFYNPYDDGSHPYGDYTKRFDTPEAAFAYGRAEVGRMWNEMRDRHAKREDADLDWFDSHVERETFVVEVHEVV